MSPVSPELRRELLSAQAARAEAYRAYAYARKAADEAWAELERQTAREAAAASAVVQARLENSK